jgi:hypothetical protein
MWKDRQQCRSDTHTHTHTGAYSRVPRALSKGVQRPVREAHHLHLVLVLRLSGAMPLLSSYA